MSSSTLAHESLEFEKPRVVGGTELQHYENVRSYGVLGGVHDELPHPSGILAGMSPFCFRRDSLESLSNQKVECKAKKCRHRTHEIPILSLPDVPRITLEQRG